ncbi:MAG: hypothetical protein WCK58_06065 [Chloroflexota bacterium]
MWKTASITKLAYKVYDYYSTTYADVSASARYAGGVELYGNILDEGAWVQYRFTVPTAVKYGTFTFAAIGKPRSGYRVPYLSAGSYGSDTEDAERWVGRSYAWYGTSFSGASHMTASHKVDCYVTILGANYGLYDVAKVRLTYRYAVLR